MNVQEATITTYEESPSKLWTGNFILICLCNFVISVSFHSLLPTLSVYIESLGGSQNFVGLALAFLTVAAVIIRPIRVGH